MKLTLIIICMYLSKHVSVPSSHYCHQNTLIQLSQYRVSSIGDRLKVDGQKSERNCLEEYNQGPATFYCTSWMPLTTSPRLRPQPVAVMERGRKLRTLEAYSVQRRTLRKLIVVFAVMARLLPKLPMLTMCRSSPRQLAQRKRCTIAT